jgi:hypothetical protein
MHPHAWGRPNRLGGEAGPPRPVAVERQALRSPAPRATDESGSLTADLGAGSGGTLESSAGAGPSIRSVISDSTGLPLPARRGRRMSLGR